MQAHKFVSAFSSMSKDAKNTENSNKYLKAFGDGINDAIKFEIDDLGIPMCRNYLNIKLPFKKIYIEVNRHDHMQTFCGNKTILGILATQDSNNNIAIMLLQSGSVQMYTSQFIAYLSPNGESGFQLVDERLADPEITECVRYAVGLVCDFCTVVNCSNIKYIDNIPASRLNKKRIKRGKMPFFSYKILQIFNTEKTVAKNNNAGTHASPRIHFRRGHVRKLANDTSIWVQQCVVGNKKNGIIHKDYKVIT